jgi:GH18 family chitinase
VNTGNLRPSWIHGFSLVFLLAGGPGCEFVDSSHATYTTDAGSSGASTTTGAGTGTGSVNIDDGGAYPLWVDLYYPGWRQDRLPLEELDLTGITHVIHFAWLPWPDEAGTGITIDDEQNGVGADNAAAVIQFVHAAGKKVLITVGGAGSGSQYFNQAMQDDVRPGFIQALIAKAVERGYDGIDIDWEPDWDSIAPNEPLFQKFSRDLRTAINTTAPHLLLTTAGLGSIGAAYHTVGEIYDQVNIMTYDLVYALPLTWHDSAVTGGFGVYYAADRAAEEYEQAGVPKRTIGIGLKCSGFSWQNATAPMEDPMGAAPRSITYNSIMTSNYSPEAYHWDDASQVPFLGITDPTPTFITYDDARSAKAKIDFLRKNRYGGLIIWDPSEQYFPMGDSNGDKHPLLKAVAEAVAAP